MKSYVRYIGIIDKSDKTHFVEFGPGINVITGKSSTGKSAMIEIFDYCFGSSEFNVPSGKITDNTQLYFIVLSVKETNIILARTPNKQKSFIKEETKLPDINLLTMQYFDDQYFILFENFKIELGRYFGLIIDDTDEDLQDRQFRQKKKARPSIRNMTPFMLQHQNLIANKHSIFYRFDEKEKREQTIDQFKIFAGFVTQEYFTTKQRLAEAERKLKTLENQQKSIDEQRKQNSKKLDGLLKEFIAITGSELVKEKSEIILQNPAKFLNQIQTKKFESNYESNEALNQLLDLKKQKNILFAQKRTLQTKRNDINSSVEYANSYNGHLNNLAETEDVKIHVSECPFCKSANNDLLNEANLLSEAISWLNNELAKSTYLLDSFEADNKKIEEEINNINDQLANVNIEINKLEKITINLKSNRGLEEQGLIAKLKIENLLESLIDKEFSNLEEGIIRSKKLIKLLQVKLKDEFNIEENLIKANKYIDNTMKQIGENFDFEDSYKPINLKFSLQNFELWHEKNQNEKIYLRSMGSGANWLYSHITLFMSLHKYFCSLGNQALIPSILFLDQPSQVYFPTAIKDTDEIFNANNLKEKEGEKEKTDDDLKAVVNMFNQMVNFCTDTLKETGIEPQIIITDHADNLKLDKVEFESLVNKRRWRKRGFILLSENETTNNLYIGKSF